MLAMKKDIIIVDDEKDIRELISGILSDEGFETRLAKDIDSLKLELIKRLRISKYAKAVNHVLTAVQGGMPLHSSRS